MVKTNPTLRQLLLQAFAIACGYLAAGIHEVGGNNAGDQVEFYQAMAGIGRGEPWCCAFVLTCIVKSYAQLMGLAEDRASLLALVPRVCALYKLRRTGSCAEMWQALKGLGIAVDRQAGARKGDLVFFHFHGEPIPHHIGFVAADCAPGAPVLTLSGNTPAGAGGDQGEGDGVHERPYGRGVVFGFGQAA